MVLIKRLSILIITAILLSGCFVFKPKNRCADCPKWGKGGHSEHHQPASSQKPS